MNAIQLLKKAGQIVDDLARLGPSTPAELAKAVSEPRPTVYRIVAALDEADVVRATGDGRYELGPALLALGDAAIDAVVDRGALHRQLRWVRAQLGLTAYVVVHREGGALCLDQVGGPDVELLDLAPGRVFPIHAGAAAQALLAFAGVDVRSAAIAQAPFARVAARTVTTGEDLARALEEAGERGWSCDDGELIDGIASIAVPVRRADGSLLGALAVSGLRAGVLGHEAAVSETLRVAAEGIGAAATPAHTAPDAPKDAGPEDIPAPPGARSPSVITKAAALMAALAQERIATSGRLTELLGEPVSSVYRMLGTLAEIGWVEQLGPRGAYRVGGKLLSLSSELTRGLDIRRAAASVMGRIHTATGETTFLCVRRGSRAVCIERIDGIRVNSRVLKLGESLPLHVGAAPRALLAFEDPSAWEEYATVAASTGDPWRHGRSRSEFQAELAQIRARGFVVSDNNVTPGIAAIGAPVFDHRGEVVASLSVSGLRDAVLRGPTDGPSVTDLVRAGARELSRYLGDPSGLRRAQPAAGDAQRPDSPATAVDPLAVPWQATDSLST